MAGPSLALMIVLSSLTVPSLPSSQPALSYIMSPANTVSCREKDKKLLEEVESAQLAAHRWGRSVILLLYVDICHPENVGNISLSQKVLTGVAATLELKYQKY